MRWDVRSLLEEREQELRLETCLWLGLPQKHAEGPPSIGHSLLDIRNPDVKQVGLDNHEELGVAA